MMTLWRRLLFYLGRRKFELELEEEMRLHLELKLEENLAAGMSLQEARRAAERDFGNRTGLAERSREIWSFTSLESFLQDVRLGIRALRARPGFAAVALLSLGLGIGANSAVFALVNHAFFRPLPVRAPEEIVSLADDSSRRMFPTFSYPDYEDFRDRSDVFSGLIAYRFAPLSVTHDGVAERMWAYLVSGNYFHVLGVDAVLGRPLSVDDDRLPGGHPVAVLSYRTWQGRFGGQAEVVGKDVVVNGRSYTIVGVAPPGFHGTDIVMAPELFLPMAMQAEVELGRQWLEDRTTAPLFVQGRLLPGVSREGAEDSLDAIAREIEREYPDVHEDLGVSLSPAGLSGPMRAGLLGFIGLLMAIVGFALLLTCTNLANLLLARALERRREIGMSLALGASRLRVVRTFLTECLLLAVAGGILGLALAWWLSGFASRLSPPLSPPADVPFAVELSLDSRVLLFTVLTSFLAAILFGFLPALRVTRTTPSAAVQDELAGGSSGRWWRGRGLVVLQVAISLPLLIGSGLVLRGLERARTLELGFEPENAASLSFDLRLQGYDQGRGRELQRRLLERLEALPQVRAAGLSDFVPVDLHFSRSRLFPEGQPVPRRIDEAPLAFTSRISPGYLRAMGTQLLEGRDFSPADDEGGHPVAIVNEALARRFWPGEDAIGKRISLGGPDGPRAEIVGVTEDGKYATLSEPPQPFVYLPLLQSYSGTTTVVFRTDSDPGAVLASVRAEIQSLDPALPVYGAKALSERLALPLFPARIAGSLLGAFALLSLVLAAVGIYGVTSQAMARRRREMGIRVALGASRSDVLELAMRAGMVPAGLGLLAGALSALLATRFMTSLLFGVSPRDPWTFLVTAALLAAVAAVASFVPARRAACAAPMASLRTE